jgi:IMP dehydrogenase
MKNFYEENALEYSDVFIIPQYSEISTRKVVNTSVDFCGLNVNVPIVSANMDTVTESETCIAMYKAGGLGAMHRFLSIERNIEEYIKVKDTGCECFVSLGVNEESKERAKSLYEIGAKYFVIDIAHGNSLVMKEMILWLRKEFKNNIVIMAGNIATVDGVINLKMWGADICKVGVGPGMVCLTKNITGVTRPQFSAVMDCCEQAKKYNMPIVADGGIKELGDACKAIAAGATMVMAGGLFAGCKETPGEIMTYSEDGMPLTKSYRGMASKAAMKTIKREEDMATPEGTVITIPCRNESVADVTKAFKGALQSSMSYSDSISINNFQEKVKFGIKKQRY